MNDERYRVTELAKKYIGPGGQKVRSAIAGHMLKYSRSELDRFLHPGKNFWVPAKRCNDFLMFFELIKELEEESRNFVTSWKIKPDSEMKKLLKNAVFSRSIRKILDSKKLSFESKVWALINEILSMRCELGA